ncbi:hypothetical protein BH09VER1_BH09VER1_28870 [soil metagenome]
MKRLTPTVKTGGRPGDSLAREGKASPVGASRFIALQGVCLDPAYALQGGCTAIAWTIKDGTFFLEPLSNRPLSAISPSNRPKLAGADSEGPQSPINTGDFRLFPVIPA